MAIITLLTDFGNKDGFVGTMKGVIWSIDPAIQNRSDYPQSVLQSVYLNSQRKRNRVRSRSSISIINEQSKQGACPFEN